MITRYGETLDGRQAMDQFLLLLILLLQLQLSLFLSFVSLISFIF